MKAIIKANPWSSRLVSDLTEIKANVNDPINVFL